MRVNSATLLAVLVATTASTLAGFAGNDAAGTCPRPLGCPTERLPAPITITNARVSYRIARTGRSERLAPPGSPYPRDAIWFPGTGTWYRIVRGHLVVGRGRKPLWRSRAKIAANQLGLIAAGPAGVAFQHDHRLYVARPDAERPVARRELPVGWTSAGLYTYSYPRRELLLRGDSGAILKTIARRPLEYQYDLANGSLYFLAHGVLMAAHGARTRRLASLSSVRMSPSTWLQPLGGGLVELLDNRRLTVLRPNGSLFASTSVRRLDRISSFLATAPGGGTVAFTGVTGHSNVESVYLLRGGAHAALAVHHERGSFGGCAQWANVEWHGAWLLYSNSDANLAAIDTVRAHRAIELSGLTHGLLGGREGFDARWRR